MNTQPLEEDVLVFGGHHFHPDISTEPPNANFGTLEVPTLLL